MGGGADSRIPAILKECLPIDADVEVVVRTYDFDPETAQDQLFSWLEELSPSILIGESLGAAHALSLNISAFVNGIQPSVLPVILVSPALNAPSVLWRLSFLALIPGVPALLKHIFKPRPGERQLLEFRYPSLKKWKLISDEAMTALESGMPVFAFFGEHDRYRRSGIVSVHQWKRLRGKSSFMEYDGSHYMEEQFVRTILSEKILATLEQECRR